MITQVVGATMIASGAWITGLWPSSGKTFWLIQQRSMTDRTQVAHLLDLDGRSSKEISVPSKPSGYDSRGNLVFGGSNSLTFGAIIIDVTEDPVRAVFQKKETTFTSSRLMDTVVASWKSRTVAAVNWTADAGLRIEWAKIGEPVKRVNVRYGGKPVVHAPGEVSATLNDAGDTIFLFGEAPLEPAALTIHRNPNDNSDTSIRFTVYMVSLRSGDAQRLCDVEWKFLRTGRYAQRDGWLLSIGAKLLVCTGHSVWRLDIANGGGR